MRDILLSLSLVFTGDSKLPRKNEDHNGTRCHVGLVRAVPTLAIPKILSIRAAEA